MITVGELVKELQKIRSDLPVNLVVDSELGLAMFGIATHVEVRRVDRNSDYVKTNDNYAAFVTSRYI